MKFDVANQTFPDRSCRNCFWNYNCWNSSTDSEWMAVTCSRYQE